MTEVILTHRVDDNGTYTVGGKMPVGEMFAEEIINNLPENPVESVKKLIEGYLEYVANDGFTPDTHFEQCIDGYALISTYNSTYDLGLEMLQVATENKTEAIHLLNKSVNEIRDKLNYMYPARIRH